MFKHICVIAGSVLLAAGMWIWIQAIAIAHQQQDSATRGVPRGNLSDLYPRWLGARELLLHKRDPYGDDITREIQVGYYGRVLDPSRPNDPKDQQAFAYPIYVVLMLAPTVGLPFAAVHRAAFWLLGLLTGLSVLLWLHTLGWRISVTSKIVWIMLTLSCFPAMQGLKLQQLTLLVAALLAAALAAIVERRLVLAGVLLALATIKPQLVFLLVLWLCMWVLGNWRERRGLLWSFGTTMAVMIGIGELLLPGWIHEFRFAMASYYRYTGGGNSILDVVLSAWIGKVTAAVLVGTLLFFAWGLRRASEATPEFRWLFSFVLATTLLVIPTFATYNQLLILPAFMLLVSAVAELWQESRRSRFFVAITAISVFWPFLAGASLAMALLFLPATTVQKGWGLPFYPSFAIPITIYATLLASRKVLCSSELVSTRPGRVLQPEEAAE